MTVIQKLTALLRAVLTPNKRKWEAIDALAAAQDEVVQLKAALTGSLNMSADIAVQRDIKIARIEVLKAERDGWKLRNQKLSDLIASRIPDDFRSHKHSWREALLIAQKGAAIDRADADEAYWAHEIAAFDRAYSELEIGALPKPIDMVLHCPKCGVQHIDAPEIEIRGGEQCHDWTNPPHRSHLCHGCGHIWRPADVPTNGVLVVKTTGKADSQIEATTSPKEAARTPLQKAAHKAWSALGQCVDVMWAPDGNCSCHISPPCNDCVEHSGTRAALKDSHAAIAALNKELAP